MRKCITTEEAWTILGRMGYYPNPLEDYTPPNSALGEPSKRDVQLPKISWVCKKDVVMKNGDKEVAFEEGKVYSQVEADVEMINEQGHIHTVGEDFMKEHFEIWNIEY